MSDSISSQGVSETSYSPHLRTALVLTGTGTAGAYHAGVVRALDEAGVKVDLIAGRGIGVVGAVFAAIDGAGRLWAPNGLWRQGRVGRLYRWRATLQASAWLLGTAFLLLLVPVGAVALGLLVYPVGLMLQTIGLDAGAGLGADYRALLDRIFEPDALPTLLPRVVTLALALMLATLAAGTLAAGLRVRRRRRSRGSAWWRLLGAPVKAAPAVRWFLDGLWQLMRGAARIARPDAADLGSRYAELLADNVGQRGFRELVVTAYDIDARSDLVFVLLAEPYRQQFFPRPAPGEGGRRQLEIFDLAGAARRHVIDALAGALSLPVATEPHLVTFSPESPWRGETHRLTDRPGAVGRLLDEVAQAGAEQVIVVAGVSELGGPHTLRSGRLDARGHAGEHLTALETTALEDALATRSGLFQSLFQIRPAHNPFGPFDFAGTYDEQSDREARLAELIDRGYEDGYRQFVDPVVGASGERLERRSDPETLSAGR